MLRMIVPATTPPPLAPPPPQPPSMPPPTQYAKADLDQTRCLHVLLLRSSWHCACCSCQC